MNVGAVLGVPKGKDNIELLQSHDWEVMLAKGQQATEVLFQVARVTAGKDPMSPAGTAKAVTWQTISAAGDKSLKYTDEAKVVGSFWVRALVTIGGVQTPTNSATVNVTRPTAAEILKSAGVEDKMKAAWEDTKAFSVKDPTHKVREEAFFVFLNTKTGKYEFSDTTYGPETQLDATSATLKKAEVVGMTLPKDDPENPQFGDSPKYVLALFHTHTPMQWVPAQDAQGHDYARPVGPSQPDKKTIASWGIVGFVYDYTTNKTNTAGVQVIPGGSPVGTPGEIYAFGED